jgi:urocanate hydratase
LFSSHEAPRVVVANGMIIPNYSQPDDDWEKFNALGVTQYGQMTAGSYILGLKGIVHGYNHSVMKTLEKIKKNQKAAYL